MTDSIKDLLNKRGMEPDFDLDAYVADLNKTDPVTGEQKTGDEEGSQLPTTTPLIVANGPTTDTGLEGSSKETSTPPGDTEGGAGDATASGASSPAPQPGVVTHSQADYDRLNAYQARLRELEAAENQRLQAAQAAQRKAAIEASVPEWITKENDKAAYELWKKQTEFEQNVAQERARAQYDQRMSMFTEASTRALTAFKGKYDNLEQGDLKTIVDRAAQSPFAKTILESDPANAIDGFSQLLEATLWQDPDLRTKAVVETDETKAAKAEASKGRKAKLGALSHGGTATTVKQAHTPSRSNYSGTGMGSLDRDRVTKEIADMITPEFQGRGVR